MLSDNCQLNHQTSVVKLQSPVVSPFHQTSFEIQKKKGPPPRGPFYSPSEAGRLSISPAASVGHSIYLNKLFYVFVF